MRSEIEKIVVRAKMIIAENESDLQHHRWATTPEQDTEALLALFEKMCNEVIGDNYDLAALQPLPNIQLAALGKNILRTTQRAALKTKLGE
jgi:hypothetical protein